MLKKLYLSLGALTMFIIGITVVQELDELQVEKGSRRVRMIRNIQQEEREREFIDLSSP